MIDPLDDQLPGRLRQRLHAPLPGAAAHRALAVELGYGRHHGPPSWDARPAAVLVLLYPHRRAWHVPLTVRPAHMLDHASQISLPGGTMECGEGAEQCAVREYGEELGAPDTDLELVGRLSPLYVFASNFWVVPCVAVTDARPAFYPSGREVARLIELPLAQLWDPRGRSEHVIYHRGVRFQARDIVSGADRVWGVTGMILAELAQVTAEACGRAP